MVKRRNFLLPFSHVVKVLLLIWTIWTLSLPYFWKDLTRNLTSTLSYDETIFLTKQNKLNHHHMEHILGPDPSSSLSILYSVLQDAMKAQDGDDLDALDIEIETKRCARYGLQFQNNSTKTPKRRRRIFAGSLLADDSWHVLFSHAIESYGIYHSVTFIESNRTQQGIRRLLRNDTEFLKRSEIFGPKTAVHVEYYINEDAQASKALQNEHKQRDMIIKAWKKQGMKPNDIGLLFDADETFTRDFLRAAQVCEIHDWKADKKQTCRNPMIRTSSIMFEGTPQCIHKGQRLTFRRWINPSMVIGACVSGIGDLSSHPPPSRRDGPHGVRNTGYGMKYNWNKWPQNSTTYPLFNAADFRTMSGNAMWQTGYHFHNFFDSMDQIRWKHYTYGHKHDQALKQPLNSINRDVNLFVKCVMDRPIKDNFLQYIQDSFQQIKNDNLSLPIAFQSDAYLKARKRELQKLIEDDESRYGRADKYLGHNLYNEKTMLNK